MADTNYVDLDIYSNENVDGSIVEHYSGDAIKNAFTSWLSSSLGEYIMNPLLGGPLDSAVFKNFSEENAERIRFKLRTTIDNNFSPRIVVRGLTVRPNFTDRVWEINIQYYIPQTDEVGSLDIFPKDISESIDLGEKVQVTYTGENLVNFIILKKSELQGQQFTYNADTGYWEWGIYQFTNFNNSSPNFSAILNLVSGA